MSKGEISQAKHSELEQLIVSVIFNVNSDITVQTVRSSKIVQINILLNASFNFN